MNIRQTFALILLAVTVAVIAFGAGHRTATDAAHEATSTSTSTVHASDLDSEDWRDCRAAVPACAPLPAGATLAPYDATAPTVRIGTTRDGVIVNIGDNRQVRIAWEETEDCTVTPVTSRSWVCDEL